MQRDSVVRRSAPVVVALVVGFVMSASVGGCGRTLSRWGIGAQKLKAPAGAQQVLGIAFHRSQAGSTIKDVVFVMDDCSVIAREYKDISPFEGELRIVSHDGKPFRQAGCVPRGAGGGR